MTEPTNRPLPVTRELTQEDNLALRWWQLGQNGPLPDLRQFLAHSGVRNLEELLGVLRVDQRLRCQHNDPILVEVYFQWYPALSQDPEKALELIHSEYLLRKEFQAAPPPEEYLQRFPRYALRLRQQIEMDRVLEADSVLDPDATIAPESSIAGRLASTASLSTVADFPEVVGHEILKELGRGGMGVVYQARHVKLKRMVALKMVLAREHISTQELVRFHVEAEAVARLQHPNIIQIYETGEQEGRPFFSLEFADGGSLAQKLNGKPKDIRQAARLGKILARAMHYAHQRGIVHRDLKPANVLLTTQGVVKITDFGLAKMLDTKSRHTKVGSILGTPSYMAPEQAAGLTSKIGPATDIYSVGTILYEVLTGRPPFLADTPMDTLLRVAIDEPVPPSQLRPGLPADLEAICLKCLRKEPDKRYLTAQELADDLGRFLEGKLVRARHAGRWERLVKWARRRPAVAALSLLVLVAVLAGFSLVTWQWLRAEANAARAEMGSAEALSRAESEARARQDETRARQEAQRRAASLTLDQGLTLCQQGDTARGLLWLARSLQMTAGLDDSLERASRINLSAWGRLLPRLHGSLEHAEVVSAAVFSPTGELLATGCKNGTAQLWHAASCQPFGPLLDHKGGQVLAIAFSADGKQLLTADHKKQVRLWEVGTGKLLGESEPHGNKIWAIAFLSLDGPKVPVVLTAPAAGAKTVELWPALGRREKNNAALRRLTSKQPISVVSVSPDGKRLLLGHNNGELTVWGVAKGEQERLIKPFDETGWRHQVRCMAFGSDDGSLIVAGSKNRTVQGWNALTGQKAEPTLLHPTEVSAAAFSPDRKAVLTGCDDGSTRLWEAATGRPLGAALLHQGTVAEVAFSPDGKTFLVRSDDRVIRLWQASPLPPPAQGATWLGGHTNPLDAVAFSSDSQRALTAGHDGTARLWDVATAKEIGKVEPTKTYVSAVAFAPDGKTFLTGSARQARLWQTDTCKPLGDPFVHAEGVMAVAFCPDSPSGRKFITASGNEAKLWDAQTRKVLQTFKHKGKILAVAVSPDGKMLLTGSEDKTAQRWDLASGKALPNPSKHRHKVTAVAFSRDGKTMATASWDKTARLWYAATGAPAGPPLQHPTLLTAVALGADGSIVLTGCWDQRARLWEGHTAKPLGPPCLHSLRVAAVALSPDGKRLLTGSWDKRAGLWPLPLSLNHPPEQVVLWSQVETGMELVEGDAVRVLDASTWRQRRQQLAKMGEVTLP
jgi:WD40 repeat protein/tRNA A-37 threonylcarbamoyl transferase component Bud32